MPSDSTATRARLLDAAFEEFAQYGFAGARVDRIADTAQANKRLIYVYYGSKEQLFDAVIRQRVGELFDAVPFTTEDLPGFAATLFDHLLDSPQLLRLGKWDQLERANSPAAEIEVCRDKVDAIGRAQKRGVITADMEPADLLVLLLGMVTSWFNVSCAIRDLATEDAGSPECLQRHRTALTTAVRRLVAPSPHPNPCGTGVEKVGRGSSVNAAGDLGGLSVSLGHSPRSE